MNSKSELILNYKSTVFNMISWIFGILVFGIGIINTFWGNDPQFGVFLVLLSFVYFPPVNTLIRKKTGFSIHVIIKIVLAIFIIWASLGVGELFAKADLMISDLS